MVLLSRIAIFGFFIGILVAVILHNQPEKEFPLYHIVIKEHKFNPEKLEIPSNVRVGLLIKNSDDAVEEFESFDLNRERIIPPHQEVVIYIGPLSPGTYSYIGEFNQETAKGEIIVKDAK